MHTINKITLNHIMQLNADQLTVLLDRLLKIEAQKNDLKNFHISVPERITVSDGGEDGRIKWTGAVTSTNNLPNQFTLFQCKATPMTPGDCYEEILVKKVKGKPRELKPRVKEVVTKNGCYVLFINHEINTEHKEPRISKIREAIKEAGHANYKDFEIKIYDAEKIKHWVNENISAVTYVQGCIGITRPQNFRTWSQWENDMPNSHITYQTNELLLKNIELIRTELKGQKVIRVIGHSGLGKTRMVLEAFREDSDDTEAYSLQAQVVYYDMGLGSLTDISGYIISHMQHQSGIIVVDNCVENDHRTIAGLVNASNNFKIVTIDFSSSTDENNYIKLERNNQKDVVEKIVADYLPGLSQTDKDYISKFSEGYPQMALLFAESVKAGESVSLNNEIPDDFLRKLVFGRYEHKDFEFHIIKACSVMSSFAFIDDNISTVLNPEEKETIQKQMDYVRMKICGAYEGREVTERDFYRVCQRFKGSNIMEQRGTQIMVKPTPLAINLAAQWWRETPHTEIKEILAELQDNQLGKRLVERLSELDQLDKAKEIVNELWGSESPFGTAEVLNTSLGSLLFRYVVEVNPVAMVKTLEKAFGHKSKEELLKIKEGRRNLVWALEKLCFRKETFNEASKILYSFAVAENETWGNNSTNQFVQLFQLLLPGTEASLMDRLEILKWGLEKSERGYGEIAIRAMGRGLSNDHFHRMGGADKQGSSAPLIDYRPDWQEIAKYWNEIMTFLTEFACSGNYLSEMAMDTISKSIRMLIRDGQIDLVEKAILKIISVKTVLWQEALNNLKQTLEFEKNIPTDIIKRIEKLIIKLTPTDVKNQLFLKVSKPEWNKYEKKESGQYIDYPKLNAESYAEYLAKNDVSLGIYLEDLQKGEQRQGFNFGAKYITLIKNKQGFIVDAIRALKEIEIKEQNPEFLAGLLKGNNEPEFITKVLDEIMNNEKLRQHSFYMTRVLNPSLSGIEKLFLLIDEYDYSIGHFNNLMYGRALSFLSHDEVIKLCERLASYGNNGKWTALSLVFMYCYNNAGLWDKSKSFLEKMISGSNMTMNTDNSIRVEGYHWSETIIKILNEGKKDEFAKKIAKQIIEHISQPRLNYSFDSYIVRVNDILFEKYFDTIWDFFGNSLINDAFSSLTLRHQIGTRNGFSDGRPGLLFRYSENHHSLLMWCRKNPEVAPPQIAYLMPLGVKKDGEIDWHPLSKVLIDEFGDSDEFLRRLSLNMGTFGSVGSSIPYYKDLIKLLQKLKDHQYQRVRGWATNKIDYTEKRIRREKLDDEERLQ
ncbi:hypothetical protein L0P88_13705 [Muricauda sp. SCSIO 64092]|uniref:hypothetical protein n=1 Tax=Allomuricauda sp. SCSIO 64092 TaxID=2908842 RepID=UPI001FF18CA7|nr:hypothetical protein [Muricauda sp. SCSIO 64092]UOY05007.1 hypothetical protein L0P88_13705 [Muricauda sp. SCSIO 64092]